MNQVLFTGLYKLAAKKMPPDHGGFLDEHFTVQRKWDDFQKKLRSKSFVEAIKNDPRSNKKLQRFSENIGRHKQSKGVPSFQVPSQTTNKNYTVKYHPTIDRFSCNCGDWTYAKSWRRGQKTRDCRHTRMVQLELRSQGSTPQSLVKEAFVRLSGLIL